MRDVFSLDAKEVIEPGDTITPGLLAEMAKFYDGQKQFAYNLSNNQCSIFAFDNPDGKFMSFQYLCHRPMNQHFKPGSKGFMTLFNKNIAPEIQRPFLEFILSAEGPWGEAWKECAIIRDEAKDGYPLGVILTNVDEANIKAFNNGITATRLNNGWGLGFFFDRFVKAGFTKGEALHLSSMFSWNGMTLNTGQNGKFMFSATPYKDGSPTVTKCGPAATDTPFSYGGPKKLDIHAFLSCKPNYTYYKGGTYDYTNTITEDMCITSYKNKKTVINPCNYMWNSRGEYGVTKSSERNGNGGFADPFKLADFLAATELKSADSRVKEIKDAMKKAEKEVVVM